MAIDYDEQQQPAPPHRDESTTRLEAFSDGVIAIAITLLVFDLRVPRIEFGDDPGGGVGTLFFRLVALVPSYFAFITSFLTIGIMWINHHNIFKLIERVDQRLLIYNLILLMGITFIVFPTAVLAEYINHPDASVAGIFYAGTFFVIACTFNLWWRWASRPDGLLYPTVDAATIQTIRRAYGVSLALYGTAALVAFVSVPLSLLIVFGLAVYYALPNPSGAR